MAPAPYTLGTLGTGYLVIELFGYWRPNKPTPDPSEEGN